MSRHTKPKANPAENSTVEKPKTLTEVLGVETEAEQIKVAQALIGEVVDRRKWRQVFVTIAFRPADSSMRLVWSDDAPFDEVIAVLEQAQRRVVEARYKAGMEAEAKKQAEQEPRKES